MPIPSKPEDLIAAWRSAGELHPTMTNALIRLGLVSSKWRVPMPEQMEVNLLRARVRELEKANREASFKIRSKAQAPMAYGEACEVADGLDDALHSEAKCLDLTAAFKLVDRALQSFEASHKTRFDDRLRQDLAMKLAESIRGVL